MPLPPHIFAPAFRHQRLSWFFIIIVGTMVYLATFAMAAEASLSAITFTWDKNFESRLTVEIPAVDDESSVTQPERVRQAIAVLRAMPDIVKVKLIPDEETARLLNVWINQQELLKTLPVPTLIDITRTPDSRLTATEIEEHIKTTVRDVHVDDYASWLADMAYLISSLSILGGFMIVLTLVTLAVAVSLICRVLMANERETITLLHIMGAEDNDIAQHFQYHTRKLSRPAAFFGFVGAVLSAGVLLFFLRHFADPTTLQPLHWLGLAALTMLVPLTAIWITTLSARVSTLKLLQSMS
jgi:cell division transport system permease protein